MSKFRAVYPGIKKIGYVYCENLAPNLMLKSIAQMPITVWGDIAWLDLCGEPVCSTVNSYKNGGRHEEVSLSFKTTDAIPVSKPVAFVVETVNASRYILGQKESPFPIVTINGGTGSRSTSAGDVVEVIHRGAKVLLEVSF